MAESIPTEVQEFVSSVRFYVRCLFDGTFSIDDQYCYGVRYRLPRHVSAVVSESSYRDTRGDDSGFMEEISIASELEVTNKEATQRIWDLIENDDLDALDEVLAEDVVLRTPGEEEVHGIDGYREYIQTYKEAFPDTTFEVHDLFVDGDAVITHFTWRATHEGELEGVEATGNTVEQSGMTINRFEDGKAVEDINYWDNLDLFQQLGVMDSPTG